MSHHSAEDNLLVAGSDSFWEPGNYKRTTRRVEDGFKLCGDLEKLVQERADLEKGYAKGLRAWSKKWNDLIEKGPEYGTTEAAWKGVLVEADRMADLHLRVKDNLCNNVINSIKSWQKETYHKSMMMIKERKEMEDSFKKAQKPWAKILTKVNKAKADYHNACKTEKSASNQERNATGDSSLSPDQQIMKPSDASALQFPFAEFMVLILKAKRAAMVKKMQDRVQKSKEEVGKTRERYETALKELNAYNPKYMEDMAVVFEKCQKVEALRLQFFKETLFATHKCLNISQDPVLPQIYEEFYHTVNNADHEKDLKWWSNNHGVNMAMNWPQFEEYTEEFRDIAKGKSKEALPAGSITLINQRSVAEDLHEYPPVNSKTSKKTAVRANPADVTKSNGGGEGEISSRTEKTEKGNRPANITNGGGGRQEGNPFGEDEEEEDEEEWEDEEDGGGKGERGGGASDPLVDTGEPGVPVRALYDYVGAEADELSFKQGELFEKLEDEDEQGWCKGRKDGRVGLYPANYVEAVSG